MHKDKPKWHNEPRTSAFRVWQFDDIELRRGSYGQLEVWRVIRIVRDYVRVNPTTGAREISADAMVEIARAFDFGRDRVNRVQRPLYYGFCYGGVQVRTSPLLTSKPVTGTRSFQFRDIERCHAEATRLMATCRGRHYVRKIVRSVENLVYPDRKLSVNVDALSRPFVIACLREWDKFTWQTRSLERYADKASFPDMLSPALCVRSVRVNSEVEIDDRRRIIREYEKVPGCTVVGLDGHDWNSAYGLQCRAIATAHRERFATSATLAPRGENFSMPSRASRVASPFYTTSSNLPTMRSKLLANMDDDRVRLA